MTLESLTKPSAKNMVTNYLASNRPRRSCMVSQELMPHARILRVARGLLGRMNLFLGIYGLTFFMEAFG